MTTINSTNARKNFFRIIEDVIKTNKPITVTGKSGNVLIISEDDYNSIQETMYLCSIPGMREKLIKGINTPLEECVEDE